MTLHPVPSEVSWYVKEISPFFPKMINKFFYLIVQFIILKENWAWFKKICEKRKNTRLKLEFLWYCLTSFFSGQYYMHKQLLFYSYFFTSAWHFHIPPHAAACQYQSPANHLIQREGGAGGDPFHYSDQYSGLCCERLSSSKLWHHTVQKCVQRNAVVHRKGLEESRLFLPLYVLIYVV